MNAEFELWAKENHCLTESAWKAWQAATMVEREACAAVCDAIAADADLMTKSDVLTDAGKMLHEGMWGGASNSAAGIRERSNAELCGVRSTSERTPG